MRRLQMEVARKAQLTVKIPDEITVGELASRMKKTAGEVIKLLMKNGIIGTLISNSASTYDSAAISAVNTSHLTSTFLPCFTVFSIEIPFPQGLPLSNKNPRFSDKNPKIGGANIDYLCSVLSSGLYRRYRNFTDSTAFRAKPPVLPLADFNRRWGLAPRPETDNNVFVSFLTSTLYYICRNLSRGFIQYSEFVRGFFQSRSSGQRQPS